MNDQAVKCTRARMIIELSDGRAVYWEARNPQEAGYESLAAESLTWDGVLSDAALRSPQPRAVLRITGGLPWLIRVERDSGEIPPELADSVLEAIEGRLFHVEHPIYRLAPYLARITGRPA